MLINYSHAQNIIEPVDAGLDVVEVAFVEEGPMPLGEQLDDPFAEPEPEPEPEPPVGPTEPGGGSDRRPVPARFCAVAWRTDPVQPALAGATLAHAPERARHARLSA